MDQPLTRRAAVLLAAGAVAAGVGVAAPMTAAADVAPQVTVTSAVFPPDGQPGPVIRTPGTFTFSVPAASGVVEFDYVLNGSLSVPPGSNAHVAAGADGTATTPELRSAQWGTNTLTVEAVTASGAVSQPTSYSFYLTGTTQFDKYSDYDGDGNADLLSVGADGGLRFSAGLGDGSVAPAAGTLNGANLTGALIAGGGDERRGQFQDLFIFQNGNLYNAFGDGLGGFSTTQEALVSPPTGMTAWPAFTQLLSPGDLTGHRRADLIGKVGDQLFLYSSVAMNHYNAPVAVAGAGWSGRTVIGVVPAANGLHDLIARDDASGQIWRYPGQAGGTFGDETTRVLIGHGLTAKRFPLVITKGDANGDGLADIWAVNKRGNLFLLPGVAGGGFGHPQKVAKHKAWAGVTALG
ncbi:hypothetical protein ABH920_002681 [Catenulispora sp. EB89]|uniref:hypothetical protein n=1 Tax=Catenulispora sp. EB89 TaxID=3156257 RepID=UPI0035197891